ncbi:MAG: glycosyltransferase family 39 protein [Gemmatimonadetes bacterium]|nr:glycosyltransferase family 39 protein [Gemmatimonadota bacterium]
MIAGLLVLLALRLVYVFLIPDAIDAWRDGYSYVSIARNLLGGVGFWDTTGEWPGEPPYANPTAPTARWLPGYPVFLAAVFFLAGESYRALYVAQALLGLAIGGLTYACALKTVGRPAALAAVGVYALDPFSVYLTGGVQTEQLFTLLVLASTYFVLGTGWVHAGLFGLFGGAAALTRAVGGALFAGLCLAGLLGVGPGLGEGPLRSRTGRAALAGLVFLLVLAPWVIRNQRVTGRPVFTTEAWQTLSMVNNDSGGISFRDVRWSALPATTIEQSEIEREAIYRDFVIEWIAAHPGRFVAGCVSRMVAFWLPTTQYATGGRALLGFWFTASLYLLAGLYTLRHRDRLRPVLPLFLSFIIFTLVYALAPFATRFRLPLYPWVEILAAAGAVQVLWARRRSRIRALRDDTGDGD